MEEVPSNTKGTVDIIALLGPGNHGRVSITFTKSLEAILFIRLLFWHAFRSP